MQRVMKNRSLQTELKVKGHDDMSVNPLMTYAVIREKALNLSQWRENFMRMWSFYKKVIYMGIKVSGRIK